MKTLASSWRFAVTGCAADLEREPVQADPVRESDGLASVGGGAGFDLLGALLQLLARGAIGF